MRGENQVRLRALDRRHGLLDRDGGEGGFGGVREPAGLQYRFRGGDAADLEDLAPAEAEQAVPYDEAFLAGRELPRHGLHPEGAAARHYDGGTGVVDLLQDARNVAHRPLEELGHMVDGAVGVHDGVFEQTFWIDVREQAGHSFLQAYG